MAKIESRIVITNATELKPGAKYLIAFEKGSLTQEDAVLLNKSLKALGIEASVAIMTDGKPTEVMKVIEQGA